MFYPFLYNDMYERAVLPNNMCSPNKVTSQLFVPTCMTVSICLKIRTCLIKIKMGMGISAAYTLYADNYNFNPVNIKKYLNKSINATVNIFILFIYFIFIYLN